MKVSKSACFTASTLLRSWSVIVVVAACESCVEAGSICGLRGSPKIMSQKAMRYANQPLRVVYLHLCVSRGSIEQFQDLDDNGYQWIVPRYSPLNFANRQSLGLQSAC